MADRPTAVLRLIPVGHPVRAHVKAVVLATFVAGALFTVFALVTAQIHAVRRTSPFRDDPYDAVVTFTMVFVPVLCGMVALRSLLCRRHLPVPACRLGDLARCARLVALLVGATVFVDWIALAFDAAHRHSPSLGLVAALMVVSCSALIPGRSAARVLREFHFDDDGDWAADGPELVGLLADRLRLPPARRDWLIRRSARWRCGMSSGVR